MSRLTSAQVIALGEYLEPTFDPASLTVSQLLGILGYHNVNYPTPYSKPKLAMIFNQEIKAKAAQLKRERVKKENSIASDDGILDGATGQPLRKEAVKRRASRRVLHAPITDEAEVGLPNQPKRRRSSTRPILDEPSHKSVTVQIAQPTLVEESEAEEDLPVKKVSRSKKTAKTAGAQSRRVSNTPAEDSGWEDNNIFQSGAESSSPVRPSPKVTRKSIHGSRKSRKSSAPPQVLMSPPSQVPGLPDESISSLSPPQFKFEPSLPSISPIDQLRARQLQHTNSTPLKPHFDVFDTGHEDDRDEVDAISRDSPMPNQAEPLKENAHAVWEEQNVTNEEAIEDGAVTHDEIYLPNYEGETWGRTAFRGFLCVLMLIALSATICFKMDSASIGYCDAGSSTNSVLEQRRADRAAVEACNRENSTLYPNNNSAAPNTTSCPIPALTLWGAPDECTQCPDHASCTSTIVLCDHGYVLRSHPLLFFVPPPSPRNTASVSSHLVDLFWSMLSILDGFPGLGSVAFPPMCIEDPERKRKIGSLGKAIESFLGRERGRRLCAGGKALVAPVYETDGGDAKKWGLEIENLREMMQKKTHPHLWPSFDDMFNEAIQQLTQWGGVIIGKDRGNLRFVAHKTPSLTWDCIITVKFREFWFEWRPVFVGLMFASLSLVYWRTRSSRRRAENKRVADLVQIALDALRNQEFSHHTDPVTTPQPYLSSLQLRDLILQDEHSVTLRSRLWDQVECIVEGNANVRANFQEIHGGDEMRVWRWVGSSRAG